METTPEQRLAVRRDECRTQGHSFDHVLTFGSLSPRAVLCSNCGSEWRIHPSDVGLNFGRAAEMTDPRLATVDHTCGHPDCVDPDHLALRRVTTLAAEDA